MMWLNESGELQMFTLTSVTDSFTARLHASNLINFIECVCDGYNVFMYVFMYLVYHLFFFYVSL